MESGSPPKDLPLRVLLVHNYYQQAGGEDVVFESEGDLLSRAGHTVERLVLDNDSIPQSMSPVDKASLAATTVWSRASADRIRDAIREHKPNVMHAHNTFPLWSPSIFKAARDEGVATVQTIHNYRLICPSADLYRDGAPCQDCVGRAVAWPSVVHACYRSSRTQTVVVAAMLAVNKARGTWTEDVDALIALTNFARTRLIDGGLPAGRIHVKPNFVDPDPGSSSGPRSGFLFVGRLTDTKGVHTLIEAMRLLRSDPIECRVAGTGPLARDLELAAKSIPGLYALGQLDRPAVFEQMRSSTAVVVPSRWYEGFPMTVVEAFATGTPVIASRLGGLAEVVSERTGLLCEPADPRALAQCMRWAAGHPTEMAEFGETGRLVFSDQYTPQANLPQLVAIYRAAMARTTTAVGGQPIGAVTS